MPGDGLHDVRTNSDCNGDKLQQYGIGGGDELRLPGSGDGRGGQFERVLERSDGVNLQVATNHQHHGDWCVAESLDFWFNGDVHRAGDRQRTDGTGELHRQRRGYRGLWRSQSDRQRERTLSRMGNSDWVQWPGYVQKSTGGGKIGSLVPIGSSVSSNAYTGDARIIQWSDGTPSARGSTNAGIAMSSTGSGYQFTAPADTTTRTLTVYVGVQNATGTLTAHLSDGSVPDYVQSYSAKSQRSDGVYTLTYRAASAGQTVTVKWTQSKGPKGRSSSSGNISLQSAALM